MNPSLTVQHQQGSYPIFIGSGFLDQVGTLLSATLSGPGKLFVVSDETVSSLYAERLINALPTHAEWYSCPAGESSKSVGQWEQLLTRLLEYGADRHSILIALGGGVPGDLAGFAAASFMRGIRFVQVPTTLLSQVDSSVGGKTGINLPQAKNSVGAFWQPELVVIDPSVLNTLDKPEYTSGLAEVVKYGVIMDEPFFELLERNILSINQLDAGILQSIIQRCCELKALVVEQDEREVSGRRAILNYGHTFGHAIEAVFGYGHFPHGHAVAMGMHAAAHLSGLLGRIDAAVVDRQASLLKSLNISYCFPRERHAEILAAMARDKKVRDGQLVLILPTRIGHVEMVSSVPQDVILEAMQRAAGTME